MASRMEVLTYVDYFGLRMKTSFKKLVAPQPERALLLPEPAIGSKNYTEECLRADTGKYYQYVGRHYFR